MYTRERVAQHVAPPPCINSVNCQFASFDVRPGKRNPIRNRHRGLLFRRISRSKIRISSQTRPFPFLFHYFFIIAFLLPSLAFVSAPLSGGERQSFRISFPGYILLDYNLFRVFLLFFSSLGSRSEFRFNSSRRPRKLKFLQKSFEQLRLLN